MSYKTVLVHLNHEVRAHRLLAVAVDIARKHDAHLIGLHVFPAVRLAPPLPLPFARQVASGLRAAIKREDEAIEALFREVTRSQPFVSEWRSVISEHRDPAATVCEHAHAADIVVTSQADPTWDFSSVLDFPDRVTLGAGRPVVVVPSFGKHTGSPRVVTLAWNGRREAARAAADAMPMLQGAETVYLLTVNEGRHGGDSRHNDREMEKALARQGVNVVPSRVLELELTAGEEIRMRALDHQADMLVMGCYGHSRMREMALGGVTRHILREMTTPVLLSH